jgi:hypothetical protein
MRTQPAFAAHKPFWNNFNGQSSWYSFALAFGFLLGLMAAAPTMQGQTFSVLYSFPAELPHPILALTHPSV